MTGREALVSQLSETWDSIDAVLAGLEPADWERPTPCPGWTVRDQVAHLIGTESMLAGRPSPPLTGEPGPHVRNDIGRFNEGWIEAFRASSPAEVLAAWRDVVAERKAQLAAMTDAEFAADSWTPVGAGTYGRFMEIRVFDCWVHEQDIRHAVGRPGHDTGPAAERSFDEMVGALGYVVGKRAGAPSGTGVTIELTGPIRRRVHVHVDGRARVVPSLDAPAAATLRMPSSTFARLACGRTDAAEALASGVVEVGGDRELGERIARHLAFTM